MEYNEQELIQAMIEGQPEAAETLMKSMQTPLFNLALRMLGNIADAEDAVQEIFIKVLDKLPGFRQESKLSTWIWRIAVNHLIDEKRTAFAQHPLSFEAYAQDILAYQQESERPDKEILAHELKLSCSNVMLQCLKPLDRCIFVLGTMFQADSREAAVILGLTPENYRQHLSRARRKMASFMSEYCYLHSGGCHCTSRIDFAIGTRRLDPENLEYSKLPRLSPSVLHAVTDAMNHLEASSSFYENEDAFGMPESAAVPLTELVRSHWMKKICHN